MFCIFAHSKSPKPQKPREKQMRVWDMGGSSAKQLDYSHRNGDGSQNGGEQTQEAQNDLVNTVTLDSDNEKFFLFLLYCRMAIATYNTHTYYMNPSFQLP